MKSTFKNHFLILTISMGVFASVMSTSMLTIAFPDIVSDFNISYETLQWRNILFFALFAVGLPFFGKTADHFGARRQFFTGIVLFALSTLCSGLTRDWNFFLIFQSLQGLADSMIVPVQVIFIRQSFPENKIGWAFGWFSGTLATATLISPAIGGLLIKHYHWNSIFWCLFGLSIISLIMALIHLPRGLSPEKKSKIPFVGAFGLLMTVIGIQCLFMNNLSTASKLVWAILAAAGIIGIIVSQKSNNGEGAIFPPGAFHNKTFILACLRVFCLYLVSNAISLYAPSYLRDVHAIPPDLVGLIILIDSVMGLAFSGIAGRAADKNPRFTLAVGMILSLGGSVFFWFSGNFHHLLLFIAIYLLLGIGGTIAMPSQNKIALLSVPPEQTGAFIGFFQMIQFGTGAFAAGLFSRLVEGPEIGKISASGFQMMITCAIALQLIALTTLLLERTGIKSEKGVNKTT
ncbi:MULTISPECIES: MFS transporter [unclassified Thermoactinomyces]|nr:MULTISPECIES: MFS transporter [unclassified Thermoactinomyces]MBH8598943.1 MFS transporter [Thermoactinomyces sp. CICC 10523]MBH8604929.1 MFS transporter [Thermoactinomyces sp. CICC 10522]MBH8608355.1 MFS transporter [Thermoactinomyces sp. CICC 10521]